MKSIVYAGTHQHALSLSRSLDPLSYKVIHYFNDLDMVVHLGTYHDLPALYIIERSAIKQEFEDELELVKYIRQSHPTTPIVFLGDEPVDQNDIDYDDHVRIFQTEDQEGLIQYIYGHI